jgi:outer membrane protein assembly factor BamB
MRRTIFSAVLCALLAVVVTGCDWTSYLGDARHSSIAPDTGIDAGNVARLRQTWRWHPASTPDRPGSIFATPVTWRGRVFVAGGNGILVALDLKTGAVLWQHDFGFVPEYECPSQGMTASAAVRPDGHGNPFLYVHAPDGYLYELNGLDGSVVWRSLVMAPTPGLNDAFDWSSPMLANGKVYLGTSSQCDNPFVQGRVIAYDQVTGVQLAEHDLIPDGYVGAGVWTSVAADEAGVYVTTGSTYPETDTAHPNTEPGFDQYSLVKLDPGDLHEVGKFPAPPAPVGDPDFGSSPVLFRGKVGGVTTQLVGACNKDGYFYTVRTDTMALVWKRKVGTSTAAGEVGCLSGAIWDGSRLFVPGNETTIDGVTGPGAIRELDPATGAVRWELPLGANPLGSGAINGNGIITVSGTDWAMGAGNGTTLLDRDGVVLRKLQDVRNFPQFSQSVFVDGALLMTNTDAVSRWAP